MQKTHWNTGMSTKQKQGPQLYTNVCLSRYLDEEYYLKDQKH